jgi:hypothetical protein
MKSSTLDKQVKRYIHKVQKLLKCSAKSKKNFIAHLKSSINAFQNESPDCTIEDILEFSGQPEKLARSFMETLDKEEIKRAQRIGLTRRIILFVLLLCIIGFLIYVIIFIYRSAGFNIIESQVYTTSRIYQ